MTLLRRHYGSLPLLFAGALNVSIAVYIPSPLRGLVMLGGIVCLFVSGYFIGGRDAVSSLARELNDRVGWLPAALHVHRREDGRLLALVEQISGEVLSLEIPEELADDPETVVTFVLQSIEPD